MMNNPNSLGTKLFFCVSSLFLLTGCDNKATTQKPGYIEGKYIYLSAPYPGKLTTLAVSAGDTVKEGQLLFVLEPSPEQEELRSAQAKGQATAAEWSKVNSAYKLQSSIYNRQRGLYNKKIIAKEEFEIVESHYQEAQDALSQAKANNVLLEAELSKIKWILNQKTIKSPGNGLINETYFQEGEIVSPGTPVMSLLKPNEIKAIFYVDANDLSRLKLKQNISILCAGCTNPVKAQISYISSKAEFTPPVLYSNETRSKLTFRVEASFRDKEQPKEQLHPGQPATIIL